MCLSVYPSRLASSAWDQPRSSIRSAMVSPGGEAQSGRNGAPELVMMVSNVNDADLGYARPLSTSIRAAGHRVMVGLEKESSPTFEVERELPLPVREERMR